MPPMLSSGYAAALRCSFDILSVVPLGSELFCTILRALQKRFSVMAAAQAQI